MIGAAAGFLIGTAIGATSSADVWEPVAIGGMHVSVFGADLVLRLSLGVPVDAPRQARPSVVE